MSWDAVPCGGCGKPVIWTITAANNKRMCVDAEPTLRGNLILMHRVVGNAPTSRMQDADELRQRDDEKLGMAQRVRFVSHFATCSAAAKYRKRA